MGPISPDNLWRSIECNFACFLGPGGVCLTKRKREVALQLRGSYLLAFLLIGTCPLSEWWVVEPQWVLCSWAAMMSQSPSKRSRASFLSVGNVSCLICRKPTSKPFTWKKMKDIHIEKSSRDLNEETAGDRLFKNLFCWFWQLKRRIKIYRAQKG